MYCGPGRVFVSVDISLYLLVRSISLFWDFVLDHSEKEKESSNATKNASE